VVYSNMTYAHLKAIGLALLIVGCSGTDAATTPTPASTGTGLAHTGPEAPPVTADTGVVPAPGKVLLRVVHAAPHAEPLDVYLTTAGASLGGATPMVDPFVYGVGSSSGSPGYVERDPGTYLFRFTRDGTHDVVLSSDQVSVAAGQVETAILFESDSAGAALGVQLMRDR
jgi:hypothetical protein